MSWILFWAAIVAGYKLVDFFASVRRCPHCQSKEIVLVEDDPTLRWEWVCRSCGWTFESKLVEDE